MSTNPIPIDPMVCELERLRFEVRNFRRQFDEDLAKAENLKALVEKHLAHAAFLNEICAAPDVDVEQFKLAEDALLESRSDLFCAIEDLFLVPAEQLGKALTC